MPRKNDFIESDEIDGGETRDRVNAHQKEDLGLSQGLEQDSDPRNPNRKTRPERIPLGYGEKLSFSEVERDNEKYVYRGFLDSPDRPGRIAEAEQEILS